MSYVVLARKYRPADFSSVTGQEQVSKSLANAIRRDKIHHALLFAGPRGVGKTSIARIFSKALNCQKSDKPTSEPCLECVSCKEIKAGTSLAVREIDGASNNSVDNVRELIDTLRSVPPPGARYKVYIIDEVHMLSTAAFNALLKSLEEPPPRTVFILATTEVHKIPDTVLSRCQRHDFRAIPLDSMLPVLAKICEEEGIKAEPEALRMIARLSDGSMRDAQSLLDRVQVFSDGDLSAQRTSQMLGMVERRLLFKLSEAILAHDGAAALEILSEVFKAGNDPGLFMKDFVSHWRELLLARFGTPATLAELGIPKDEAAELKAQADKLSAPDVQDLVQIAREGCDSAMRSSYPRYALEALVVRMATRRSVKELGDLINEIKQSGGLSAPAARQPQPAARPQAAVPSQPQASRSAEPAPPAQESRRAPTPAPAGALDWAVFVRFVDDSKGKMLAEQLKRLSIDEFKPGVLTASGPTFCVKTISGKETLDRLKRFLAGYSKVEEWNVNIRESAEGSGKPPAGSLVHEERRDQAQKEDDKRRDIANHPKIKSLQRVFPGSKIENIKINKE